MLGLFKKKVDPNLVAMWFKQASAEYEFTPDFWNLQRRPYWKLFIYGTQMEGHREHDLVGDHAAYGATAYTEQPYMLWKKDLGKESFPVALTGNGWNRPSWARPPMHPIQGELYIIETAQLVSLDRHYQNTLEFERIRVPLSIPYQQLFKISSDSLYPHSIKNHINESLGISEQVVAVQKKIYRTHAWAYIGKPEYWHEQFGARPFRYFSPVGLYQSRLGFEYYHFSKNEYSNK